MGTLPAIVSVFGKKTWQNDSLPCNSVIHQDTEIVSQKRPSDPERVCGGNDEYLTKSEQRNWDDGIKGLGKKRDAWLILERALVSG